MQGIPSTRLDKPVSRVAGSGTMIHITAQMRVLVAIQHVELLTTVPLLIIDDLGMRKLPLTAAEELLEIIMRRYERANADYVQQTS
jgi:hypothetical protein